MKINLQNNDAVLIAETLEESAILDVVFGDTVADGGFIGNSQCECRSSGGEHKVIIQNRSKQLKKKIMEAVMAQPLQAAVMTVQHAAEVATGLLPVPEILNFYPPPADRIAYAPSNTPIMKERVNLHNCPKVAASSIELKEKK